MKSLSTYLLEGVENDKIKELEKRVKDAEEKADDAEKAADDAQEKADDADKADETIKDEKSFREAAKAKFEEVFGDDLDEDQMNETIDGILKKYKKDADNGDWGKLIGVLNKSFGG